MLSCSKPITFKRIGIDHMNICNSYILYKGSLISSKTSSKVRLIVSLKLKSFSDARKSTSQRNPV